MEATYTHRDVEIYRAKQDVNGNPRWIVWFLAFDNLEPERVEGEPYHVHLDRWANNVADALCGGARRYRGSDFGGGVVFQSYDPKADVDRALDTVLE